jgi:hypothetical protein
VSYQIIPEFYVTPAVYHDGRHYPPISFEYAIRRTDGSLAFRAVSLVEAAELLSNLLAGENERRAA